MDVFEGILNTGRHHHTDTKQVRSAPGCPALVLAFIMTAFIKVPLACWRVARN